MRDHDRNQDDKRKQGEGAERRRPEPGDDGEKFNVSPEIDVRDRDEGYHRIPSSDERAMGGAGRSHPDRDETDDESAREASGQSSDQTSDQNPNQKPNEDTKTKRR